MVKQVKTYRWLFFLASLMWAPGLLLGEEVRLSVSAPSSVAQGERFRLTYSVNARPEAFNAPRFEDFTILSGPSQSTSSSTQIINNQVTTSMSISYAYVLEALGEGEFQIPPASVVVDGREYRSEPVEISVTGSSAPPSPGRDAARPGDPQAAGRASPGDDDIFLRAVVDNPGPYQGQQVIVRFLLYTRLSVSNYSMETLPSFQDMWTENLTDRGQAPVHTEQIDGHTYQVAEIRRVAAFPQRSGELRIGAMEVEAAVRMPASRQGRPGSIFDEFFGSSPFDRFRTVNHRMRSQPLVLDVKPLPVQGRPDSFAGLVGSFTLEAGLSQHEMQVNDASNLRITLRGEGNLHLARPPAIAFPAHLEVFDPQVSDNIRSDRQGISGSLEYDYVIIPRSGGLAEIPEIRMTYFDPRAEVYRTLSSGPFTIRVEGEAMGPGASPERSVGGRYLADDIRFIQTGPANWVTPGNVFFRSTPFHILMTAPFVLLALALLIWRKRLAMLRDTAGMRTRKARSMAVRRLRNAAVLMKQERSEDFFHEVFRALWGYVSDRLNIPVSQLNKDNVVAAFRRNAVDESLAERFLEGLQECEFARFAPRGLESPMQRSYQKALETLTTLEKELSRPAGTKKKGGKISPILLIMFLAIPLQGVSHPADSLMARANEAYIQENYAEAIALYSEIALEGWSSRALHYNLGNAWFKEGRPGKAILNYERALRISPRDEAVLHNLGLAREQITDRSEAVPQFFLQEWWDRFAGWHSADGWAIIGLVLVTLSAAFLALYFLSRRPSIRILGMGLAFLFLLGAAITSLAASHQYRQSQDRSEAIILDARVVARSSPGERGIDLFVVHEGTKAEILNELMGWVEIRLPNGKVGWVRESALELI